MCRSGYSRQRDVGAAQPAVLDAFDRSWLGTFAAARALASPTILRVRRTTPFAAPAVQAIRPRKDDLRLPFVAWLWLPGPVMSANLQPQVREQVSGLERVGRPLPEDPWGSVPG